jgi:hypothetical protein
MLTRPMLSIQILFTNYDIITDFLNLAFCSEHFISIKHRILATFNINKKFNSDSLCAFKCILIHIFVYVSSSLTFDYAMYQTNLVQKSSKFMFECIVLHVFRVQK